MSCEPLDDTEGEEVSGGMDKKLEEEEGPWSSREALGDKIGEKEGKGARIDPEGFTCSAVGKVTGVCTGFAAGTTVGATGSATREDIGKALGANKGRDTAIDISFRSKLFRLKVGLNSGNIKFLWYLVDILEAIIFVELVDITQRFLPSEFGNDADRVHAVEPAKTAFARKSEIRRAIEAEGIPFKYSSSNYFAGVFLRNLAQPGATAPPTDKVVIYGDGNGKVMLNASNMLLKMENLRLSVIC
ncbi:hypothetical protein Ancab_027419 [Ancistrocladus abbreviatus]